MFAEVSMVVCIVSRKMTTTRARASLDTGGVPGGGIRTCSKGLDPLRNTVLQNIDLFRHQIVDALAVECGVHVESDEVGARFDALLILRLKSDGCERDEEGNEESETRVPDDRLAPGSLPQ